VKGVVDNLSAPGKLNLNKRINLSIENFRSGTLFPAAIGTKTGLAVGLVKNQHQELIE
jgi:hypothetical protein